MAAVSWRTSVALPLLTAAGCYLSIRALRYLSSRAQLSTRLQHHPCDDQHADAMPSALTCMSHTAQHLLPDTPPRDLVPALSAPLRPSASSPLPPPPACAPDLAAEPGPSTSLQGGGEHVARSGLAAAPRLSGEWWQQGGEEGGAPYNSPSPLSGGAAQPSAPFTPSTQQSAESILARSLAHRLFTPHHSLAASTAHHSSTPLSHLAAAAQETLRSPPRHHHVAGIAPTQCPQLLLGRLTATQVASIQKERVSLDILGSSSGSSSSSSQRGQGESCRVLLLNVPAGRTAPHQHQHQHQQQRVLCALKLALPGASDAQLVEEVRLMAVCGSCPLVLQCYGLLRAGGRCGVLLEAGSTDLGAVLQARQAAGAGGLPPDSVLHIARCLTRAVRDIHAAGVLHFDIQPRNVLLCGSTATPKLADFGAGSPAHDISAWFMLDSSSPYLAPEVRGECIRPSAAWDWFSLGVTLLELCLGRGLSGAESEALGSGSALDWGSLRDEAPALQQCEGLVVLLQGLLQHSYRARAHFGSSLAVEVMAGMPLPHAQELLGTSPQDRVADMGSRAAWVA